MTFTVTCGFLIVYPLPLKVICQRTTEPLESNALSFKIRRLLLRQIRERDSKILLCMLSKGSSYSLFAQNMGDLLSAMNVPSPDLENLDIIEDILHDTALKFWSSWQLLIISQSKVPSIRLSWRFHLGWEFCSATWPKKAFQDSQDPSLIYGIYGTETSNGVCIIKEGLLIPTWSKRARAIIKFASYHRASQSLTMPDEQLCKSE